MKSVLRKSGGFVMAILMGALICSISASAVGPVLYTTLGPNGQYDPYSGYVVGGSNHQVMAAPFTFSAGATVGDVVLALGHLGGTSNNPVDVYIESDNGGLPGTIIASLTQVGTIPPWLGNAWSLVTFNCSGVQCTLGAGSYWLVVFEPDAYSGQGWNYAYRDQMGNMAAKQNGGPEGGFHLFWGPEGAFRIDGASGTTP